MATNTYSTAAPAQRSAAFGNSILGNLRRSMQRWSEQNRIRTELHMMTARELADLGLAPSDIDDVATGRYRRGD